MEDFSLDIIETLAKDIFSGKDEIQKLKLSERLKNLLNLNVPEKSLNPVQGVEVSSVRNVALPDEIWLKIIQYLPTKHVFGKLALTCKKFHNLSQDSNAIKYLQVKTINTWSKYENVNAIITSSKVLVQLTIIQSGDFDNELICQAFESNPRLRALRIKTKTLNTETINTIAKSKLEILDLNFEDLGIGLGHGGVNGLCNIKTLKSLRMNPNNHVISTLARNSTPIEAIDFLLAGQYLDNHVALNEFFKSKKDTFKSISFWLPKYENVPLTNLTLCQNLEKIVMCGWHSNHVEKLSGMPNLKYLSLIELDAKVDTLVKFFRRLSLQKLEHLSIQYCPNAKEEFFVELSKLDFSALTKLSFYQSWKDKVQSKSKTLTNSTLQTLVSKCPNLKIIQFGDNFGDSNISFKTIVEIFEKRNVFLFIGRTLAQHSLEQYILYHNKILYEKYQKLKPICMQTM